MMWLKSWRRNRKPNRCLRRAQGLGFGLRVESLESRTVLSSFTAANGSDLIADIRAANKSGGSSTITLTAPASSHYVLAAVDNTTNGANGLPVIGSGKAVSLTIIGNGDTIERGTAAGTPAFRLFDLAAGSSLSLQSLTLQDGLAQGAGAAADGGAIYNQGTLTLTAATVENNIAQGSNGANGVVTTKLFHGQSSYDGQVGTDAAGGGIWSSGSVTLQGGTTLQGNQARGGRGGDAGWVGNASYVDGSTVGSGGAGGGGFGGGLYQAGGSVNASHATFSANDVQGGFGGGVENAPSIAVGPPTNTTGVGGKGSGGGLYVAGGTLTLTTVSVQSNQADGGNGGHFYRYYAAVAEPGGEGSGGGMYAAGGTVNLDTVDLSANSAYGGGAGSDYDGFSGSFDTGNGGNVLGGGLYASGASVTLTGGTVSNNVAWGGGGGSYVLSAGSPGLNEGGGVFTSGGTLAISSSTLSGNYAWNDGGGLYVNGGTVTVDSCTLSGNFVDSPGHGGAIDNNAGAGALTVRNGAFSNNYVYFYNTPDNLFGPYTDGGGNTGLP